MTIASFAIPRPASSRPVRPARTIADWCRRRPVAGVAPELSEVTMYRDGRKTGTAWVTPDVLREMVTYHSEMLLGPCLFVVSAAG